MSGTRVHDLAKKLGMESKVLLAELKKLGIAVKSHSSTLDDDAVQTVTSKLGGGRPAAKDEAKPAARKAALVRKDAPGKAAAVPVEEPPKADKKRLLFKKKKEEEPAAEVETAPQPMTPLHHAVPAHDVAPAAAPVHEPLRPAPAIEHVPPGAPSAPPPAAAAPALAPAPGAVSEALARKKKEADSGLPPADAGLKDKLKRVKKTGRVKDDDELRFREDAARWQDLRAIPVHRREDRSRHQQPSAVTEITKPRQKAIKLTAGLTVKEFSELVGQRPADVMRKLMDTGQMLTLNQPMNLDAAQLIAESYGVRTEIVVEKQGEELL